MANTKKKEEEATGKEVAVKKGGTAVAAYDYGEYGGEGFEGTSSSDLSIPFLAVLQSNSPVVEEEEVEGAKAGMLYNTVTREIISGEDGVVFLPVHKDVAYVEWIPRDSGGGFVGLFDPQSAEVKKAIADNGGNRIGKLKLENGNELIETHYVYGLLLDPSGQETTGFAVLSFTSTKIKPCRDWFTAMYTLKGKPPLFANRAVLKTVKQKNEKGTFYNFRIDPLKATWKDSLINPKEEAHLLQEAREFREMVTSGMAKAAFETENAAGGTEEAGKDGVPF